MKLFLSVAALLFAGPLVAAPDDLEDAFQRLQEAESKKDPAVIKKLAQETSALAQKEASAAAPEEAEQKDSWTKRLAYAREVANHADYALFAAAVQGPPATTVELLSTLEQQNPKSQYLDEAYGSYFVALTKVGSATKIPAVAGNAINHFPENEDLLLVLADNAMNRKQSDRALSYAERLIGALNKHPVPKGMPAAEWERKKTAALGRGHWIAGLIHAEKSQFFEADKDLRAALPLIKGDDAMMGPALFYLGVANYQLGSAMRSRARVLEAAKFSDAAAAIKGPLAAEAWRNAHVMRTEAAKLR